MRWNARLTAALGLVAIVATGCNGAPTMNVPDEISTGEDVVVTFEGPHSGRATNQYWIALQREDAPESETAGRVVLERFDTEVRLPTYAPGRYEVRLHAQYPKKDHHVVARAPVEVKGWPVKAAAEGEAAPASVEEVETEHERPR
jgi:hypothetical protein